MNDQLTGNDKIKILELLNSCNELISGRFLLADKKISKVLKLITEIRPVFDLISQCMSEFNKGVELSKAYVKLPSKPGKVNLPEDEAKILPLVFCTLVDLDSGKLELKEFLAEYFTDKKLTQFEKFGEVLILPFRNILSEVFEVSGFALEDNEREEEAMEEIKEESIFTKINRIAKEMIACLNVELKNEDLRSELNIVIMAIMRECAKEDLETIGALIISLKYMAKKAKCIMFLRQELEDVVLEFYGL